MSDVDPRYDPRYQRGFDAARDATPAPATRRDNPALRSPIETAPAPVDLHAAAPRPEATTGDPDAAVADVGAEGDDGAPASRTRAARAAFVAVPIVSAVMIVAGAAMLAWSLLSQFRASTSTTAGPTSYLDYALPQVLATGLAPALLTAGFIGLIMWLILIAAGRRRA